MAAHLFLSTHCKKATETVACSWVPKHKSQKTHKRNITLWIPMHQLKPLEGIGLDL